MQKYGSVNVWRWVNDVFDYLPISGLIDNRLLCVHGGLSPECRTLDQVLSSLISSLFPHFSILSFFSHFVSFSQPLLLFPPLPLTRHSLLS